MLPRRDRYEEVYADFRWSIPARYNIAASACERWAEKQPDRLAILHVQADGSQRSVTYRDLQTASGRLANALTARGVRRGDRVAVLLPQAPETAVSHIAAYRM